MYAHKTSSDYFSFYEICDYSVVKAGVFSRDEGPPMVGSTLLAREGARPTLEKVSKIWININ